MYCMLYPKQLHQHQRHQYSSQSSSIFPSLDRGPLGMQCTNAHVRQSRSCRATSFLARLSQTIELGLWAAHEVNYRKCTGCTLLLPPFGTKLQLWVQSCRKFSGKPSVWLQFGSKRTIKSTKKGTSVTASSILIQLIWIESFKIVFSFSLSLRSYRSGVNQSWPHRRETRGSSLVSIHQGDSYSTEREDRAQKECRWCITSISDLAVSALAASLDPLLVPKANPDRVVAEGITDHYTLHQSKQLP